MAVIVKTNNPSKLLSNIKKAIDSKDIDTWTYDSDGDFTHSPDQWKNKGWLKPQISENGELRFGLIGQKTINTTTVIYAIYHGRFIEMLLSHFDSDFTDVYATAMPSSPDVITSGVVTVKK